MSLKTSPICRKFSLILIFMLLLQFTYSQNSFSKLDDWMKDNLKDLGGRAVLVIYKDGKIIYNHSENNLTRIQKFVGKRIAKKQGKDAGIATQDFNSSSKELIASCSKWLSAALVMTFVDEGKLQLEDTVGKFLPAMTLHNKGAITIRQCLSHLTGIKTGEMKDEMKIITQANNMDEAIENIAKKEMEGEPGKTFHYSSTGLQITAAVIEKISGLDFKTLFAERIAYRCNMLNTDWGDGNVPLAAGGARSTADDYIKFLEMILNEGKYDDNIVLTKNSVIEMQKNNIAPDAKIVYSPAEAGNWGYGFGEWVMDNPSTTSVNLTRNNASFAQISLRSNAVTSPGLFGSFPWIDNEKKYAAFLMVFNLKNNGRNEKYKKLKKLVDDSVSQ